MTKSNQDLINEFQAEALKLTPIPKASKTFLEILKISHREVAIGNLLAYFFNPDQNHDLGTLFLRCLFDTVCYDSNKHESNGKLASNGFIKKTNEPLPYSEFKLSDVTNIRVVPEDPTKEHKRIDILIEADQFVIAIEFKINHLLDNPLHLYEDHVLANYCNKEDKPIFFVVLTPSRKKHENLNIKNTRFKQITLTSFVEKLKEGLDKPEDKIVSNPYYPFLIDFIRTIENRTKQSKFIEQIKDSPIIELFKDISARSPIGNINSEPHVKQYLDKLISIEANITSRLQSILTDFKGTSRYKTTTSYKKIDSFEGFTQILIPKTHYAIKARLTLTGWSIEKWEKTPEDGYRKVDDIQKDISYNTSHKTISLKIEQELEKYSLIDNLI
ncbi:MAG: hypothetical protein JWR54_3071 [Mucilaginibacter sp.]|nr:hypothetical protein [Mucilaginibacter sp.]